MTLYIKALIAAALFALGLAVGWVTQGWRADAELSAQTVQHQGVIAGIARKTADAAAAVRRYEQAANAAIQAADEKSTKGIADAKAETDRLRECVRAGTCGVRIVTRVVRDNDGSGAANPSACAVGNAAVELDQDVQQRVLDLRESIERDAEAISYLQRYAEACFNARGQAAE